MLVREARLAVTSLEEEMSFLHRLVVHHERPDQASKP
jgi:hypothetical protein